jgi:hypothetical protein
MSTSKHIIGFASQYYTLWTYRTETTYVTDAYGKHWPSQNYTYYTFHKNISKDLDKVKASYPDTSIDEGLRGKQRSFSVKGEVDLTPELIKFGKYNGYTISEIADMDFNYLLWLRDNVYGNDVRALINQLPQIVGYDEKIRLDEEERINSIRKSFLKAGEYTVSFQYNPNEFLHQIHQDYDISFAYDCPQFVLDNLSDWKRVHTMEYVGGRLEPLAAVFGMINDVRYLIVFPQYKQVNGMYPYKMGYINGKIQKTKGKEFTTQLVPIGFTHLNDETQPIYQILCVV